MRDAASGESSDPVVHAGPGLVGHCLFDRNWADGDVSVMRKDFSPLRFIAGNRLMTREVLRGRDLLWPLRQVQSHCWFALTSEDSPSRRLCAPPALPDRAVVLRIEPPNALR
jgi:hypothetical protein